ncbi:MAG: hypothetical protein ACRD8U_07115, partial [Pyrinomonadaceae bacterium]
GGSLCPVAKEIHPARACNVQSHTSTVARQWLIDHISPGSRILVETYGPQLPANFFEVFIVDESGRLSEASSASENFQGWQIGRIKDITGVQAQSIKYIVMSNAYERFLAERGKYPGEIAAYEKLMNSSNLIYDSEHNRGMKRGPRIRVYRLRANVN